MAKKFLIFCVLLSFAILALYFTRSPIFGVVVHRVDGWCLSYEEGTVVHATKNRMAQGKIPNFLIPADFPRLSIKADPGETGLVATYTNRHGYSRERAINNGAGPGLRGCTRVPLNNGLSQIVGEGLPECSVRSTHDWHHDRFEPTVRDELHGAIQISCARNDAVLGCRMTDILANGWKVTVSLPKNSLDEWQVAARAAESFFENKLTDCGEN